MTLELHDTASFNGSIGNTNNQQLSVQTSKADHVEILIDDGTTGNDPPTYDIRVDIYSTAVDDWMEREEQTSLTTNDPGVEENARGQQYRITVTNQSGSSANFRISLEAFKEI